jgi:hypothetical protein
MKVGDKVKGVTFNNNSHTRIGFISEMLEYVGVEGKIVRLDRDDDSVKVKFKDGNEYWYPVKYLIKQLESSSLKEPILKVLS